MLCYVTLCYAILLLWLVNFPCLGNYLFLKSGCMPWVQPTEFTALYRKLTIYRKFFVKTFVKKKNPKQNTDVVMSRSRAHLLFIYSDEKYCRMFILICTYFCFPFPQSKQLWQVRFHLGLIKSSVCLSDWLTDTLAHTSLYFCLCGDTNRCNTLSSLWAKPPN